MPCFANDPELLSPAISHSFALRRNIRIKTSKLPPDFFPHPHPHPCRYGPTPFSPRSSRQMGVDLSNREVRTPSFDCRKHSAGRARRERKAGTARGAEEVEELGCTFSGAGRRVQRGSGQESIDFKNSCSIDLDEQQWRLPRILNRGFHPRR